MKKSIFTSTLFSILFVLSAAASVPKQVQSFNFDFDDNIFTTDAKIYIWDTVNQLEVAISTANWALVKEKVGKDGVFKNFVMKPNGLREFGDTGPLGTDLFKEQIARALKNGNWKGPSWDAFVASLSNQDRNVTTVITARLHSPKAIEKGLALLHSRGLIPAMPRVQNLFPVMWPEFTPELKGSSPAESKSKVMLQLLDEIESTPLPTSTKLVTNQEGTGTSALHLWGFSDDDHSNFAKAQQTLTAEVAKGRWPHIKILLYFTGLNNPEHKPHSVVIKSDGTTRAALDVEGKLVPVTKSK